MKSLIYTLIFIAFATFLGIYFVYNFDSGRTRVPEAVDRITAPTRNYTVERDKVYVDKIESQRQILDLYYPKEGSQKPKPVVLWIHGGGWLAGDKNDSPPVQPLIDAGYIVAAVNYRFLTEDSHPAQVQDVKAAVRWLRANHEKLKIDDNNIALMGYSAGGHLASLAGLSQNDPELEDFSLGNATVSSHVNAVVAMAAPIDLSLYQKTSSALGDAAQTSFNVEKFLGCKAEECSKLFKSASPINYVDSGDVPVFVQAGEIDKIVPITQAEEFVKALSDAKVQVQFDELKDANHSYKVNESVINFLKENLGK